MTTIHRPWLFGEEGHTEPAWWDRILQEKGSDSLLHQSRRFSKARELRSTALGGCKGCTDLSSGGENG